MKRAILALTTAFAVAAISGTAVAQAKPKLETYVVCNSDGVLIQTLKTAQPVSFTVSAMGAETSVYFAVYELAAPVTCQTLAADSTEPGPFPTGINLEGDLSHKPTLKV